MKRLTVYLFVLVLLVAGASLGVYRAWRGGPAPELQTSGEQPAAAGTGSARVLLNEILFNRRPVSHLGWSW